MKKITLLKMLVVLNFLFMTMTILSMGQEMDFTITSTLDKVTQVYQCGEQAKITFTVVDKAKQPVKSGTLAVHFTNDNMDSISTQLADLAKDNPVSFTITMDKPSFVSARTSYQIVNKGKKKVEAASLLTGIAFDPEKIQPGQPEPKDFRTFVAEGKKEVRAIPIDVQQEKIERFCNENRDVYSISFATINNQRVYGFLSIPKKEGGPFPTIINVPGAGPGRTPDVSFVDKGYVAFVMNVFPYPVPLDAKERQTVYDNFNKDLRYTYQGAKDRKEYFFRAAYLGIDRAIDWLAEQKYVDKNRIGFYGASQGGASALILSGMNKNIKWAVSGVPALCDHGGCLQGRASGWPQIYRFFQNDPKVIEASPYMDAVNYAHMVECPIKVTVGFIDTTCSPSSVYSAYNVIPSKDKEMLQESKLGHRTGQKYSDAMQWLEQQLKK